MSPEIDRRIPAALFILRFFLAIFLLQWSIEKLILPDAAARIARSFYGMTLAVPASYALGVAELILSLALLLGFYRTISYGLSLLVHTVTVIVNDEIGNEPSVLGRATFEIGKVPSAELAKRRAARCCASSSAENSYCGVSSGILVFLFCHLLTGARRCVTGHFLKSTVERTR
jgi:uncharacterized membrane protein YphA (DoxX/SURF4 family)